MVAQAGLHRWRHAQRLMHAREFVIDEVERDSRSVIHGLLETDPLPTMRVRHFDRSATHLLACGASCASSTFSTRPCFVSPCCASTRCLRARRPAVQGITRWPFSLALRRSPPGCSKPNRLVRERLPCSIPGLSEGPHWRHCVAPGHPGYRPSFVERRVSLPGLWLARVVPATARGCGGLQVPLK